MARQEASPASRERPPRRAALLRLAALALVLGGVVVLAVVSGWLPSAARLREWVDGYGAAGPVVFIVICVGLGCLLLPAAVYSGAAGLLFDTAAGTPIAITVVVLTAAAEFVIARRLVTRQAGSLLPEKAHRLDEFLERRGFRAILYINLPPGPPHPILGYAAGLTRMRLSHLVAGTAIGCAPRIFAFVALGGSLDDLGAPEVKVAIALLVVLGIGGAVYARRQVAGERRRRRRAAAETSVGLP